MPVNNYYHIHHNFAEERRFIYFAAEASNLQTVLILVTSVDATEIRFVQNYYRL